MRAPNLRDLRPAIDLELERGRALLDLELLLERRELLLQVGSSQRALVAPELVLAIAGEGDERVFLFASPRRARVDRVRLRERLVRGGRSRSFQNIGSLDVVPRVRRVVGLFQRAIERLVRFDGPRELRAITHGRVVARDQEG